MPGTPMSKLTAEERYYAANYDKWVTLRPLIEQVGVTIKGYIVPSLP